MDSVTVFSDFGVQENKIYHCFHFSLIYLPWNDGSGCHDLHFLMLNFKPAFSLFSFTLIKSFFSSSSLVAIWSGINCISEVVDFSLSNLDSSLWFIQPSISHDVLWIKVKYAEWWYIALTYFFPNFEPVFCSRSVLTVASWPAYKFLRRQVKCSGNPILKNFPQYVVIHTVKGFNVVNEVDIFLEFPCFSMIQWMLVIRALVPLPLLNPACVSTSCLFTCY